MRLLALLLLAGAQPTQTQLDAITAKLSALDATVKTFVALGPVQTGGSGALNCAVNVCDIVSAIVPLKPAANAWTGANDFSNSSVLGIPAGTPTASTAPCTPHQLEHDTNYLYVCVAVNKWARAPISSAGW